MKKNKNANKVSISPLQNQIMRILEEAGGEDIRTINATLQAEGSNENEIDNALAILQDLGYIEKQINIIITKEGNAALHR